MTRAAGRRAVSLVFLCTTLVASCGKKGPPLPPLIILPAAPAEFSAARRGDTVDVRFLIPRANVDGSEPANLSRVDVYALTGPGAPLPDDIITHGTRVGTVTVNIPPDPDAEEGTAEAQTPPVVPGAPGAPGGPGGLDQGAVATLTDALALLSDADVNEVRSYLAVGVNRRGRRGQFSEPITVPLGTAPAAPSAPSITFDEKSITVSWTPSQAADGGTFPRHVYAVEGDERRLTERPTLDASFSDSRIDWGAERCYALRIVESIGGLMVESPASPKACVTPVDTFPPAAPEGLNVVAAQGAMNLIWNANTEADVAGYILLRTVAPSTEGQRVSEALIEAPTFTDTVSPGSRVTYVVQAVDSAGNLSPASEPVTETAR